jgi:hypothetical protein
LGSQIAVYTNAVLTEALVFEVGHPGERRTLHRVGHLQRLENPAEGHGAHHDGHADQQRLLVPADLCLKLKNINDIALSIRPAMQLLNI